MTGSNLRRACAALGLGALLVAQAPERSAPPVSLARAAVEADLDFLQKELEARFSYLRLGHPDYKAAFAALRAQAKDGLIREPFALGVQRIISLFGDSHAGLLDFRYPGSVLPFQMDLSGEQVVAFQPDRSAFLDPARPCLAALDGRLLADWLKAAEAYIPKGSPQFRRFRGIRFLRSLAFLRRELGLPAKDTVTVEVASPNGKDRRTLELPLAKTPPKAVPPTLGATHLLENGMGYLRLAEMREETAEHIKQWMPRFRDSRALIVDVRGNGGGTRDALRAFFPYLLKDESEVWVTNVAVARLYPKYTPEYMAEGRFLFKADFPGWRAPERHAIQAVATSWKPEWVPPPGEFSDWYYMVMARKTNPAAYFYDRPVVVLQDYGCFSATDIFVSSLKGWRNVTLMGTPSGGGSAYSQGVELPQSRLRLRIGSIISFNREGIMHDGHGTEPDIRLERTPESMLKDGRDNQLEAAVALLERRSPTLDAMMKGARTLVGTCAAVNQGETALIVTDPPMQRVAAAVAAAVREAGAEPVIALIDPRGQDSSEPPRAVAEAMKASQVIFSAVSISITHTKAVKEAVAAGSRMIALTAVTDDMLVSGGMDADFARVAEHAKRVGARLGQAKVARITSREGTDLTFRMEGRRINVMPCIVTPGAFSPAPNAEVNVSPIEGTANGTLVADASIPYLGIGLLKQPIRFTVCNGFITAIEGGDPEQVALLKGAWERQADPNVFNIAEMGIGLNPQCTFRGIMMEDEGVLGSIHIGTGTSLALGGTVKARSHYDLIMAKPTLTLDGHVVVADGVVKM